LLDASIFKERAMSGSYGAMSPNWLDREEGAELESASAEDALTIISKCPQLIDAVREAIRESEDAKARKIMGPTRSQRIRKAIAEKLVAAE
jgi:hypothetical protein